MPPWEAADRRELALDRDRPPGYAIHVVHDDRRITTWFRTLDRT